MADEGVEKEVEEESPNKNELTAKQRKNKKKKEAAKRKKQEQKDKVGIIFNHHEKRIIRDRSFIRGGDGLVQIGSGS